MNGGALSIVCEQCYAPPMLCLPWVTVHHWWRMTFRARSYPNPPSAPSILTPADVSGGLSLSRCAGSPTPSPRQQPESITEACQTPVVDQPDGSCQQLPVDVLSSPSGCAAPAAVPREAPPAVAVRPPPPPTPSPEDDIIAPAATPAPSPRRSLRRASVDLRGTQITRCL
ncbi:nascent polypeptide-associated complex subunit alpha, muscle-specific form-like [Lytechinus variegatus]|uniref:nascent polypeptide-associated complex subunit alpha, muscle-specific form-like n=1 Tax=Lytechinus variegatus TaxID=7654 RepID=UPI001BB0F3D3|nr:nascent polypeptide-associated complex subunit alpha, muscle-specific form-like [Lytechinus variegatus]